MMQKNAAVIINASSGLSDANHKIRTLRDAFDKQNIVADFFLAHKGVSIKEITQKALGKGHNLIAVAGGDGTINAVASQLVDTEAVLGILPWGTFNHLAQDLRIPLGQSEAVAVLASGRPKRIDAAQVNKEIFLNNSSIGIYSKLVGYRENHQKLGWSKRVALAIAMGKVLWRYPFLTVEVEVHGQKQLYKTPLVFIGNNHYKLEGLDIGSRISLEQGKLCVYIIKSANRLDLIKLGLYGLVGNLSGHAQLESFVTSEVKLETKKQLLKVALDGEVVSLSMPLHYVIRPLALTVMVPAK